MVRWIVGSILNGEPSRGMCYSVCGMMHIKEALLQIVKSNPCGGSGFPLVHIQEKCSPCIVDSGFPLSLSEWSFTICPKPYNRK